MTILEVNSLTKAFGANTILEGVSFKVNQGEKVGLIGENGSGKVHSFKDDCRDRGGYRGDDYKTEGAQNRLPRPASDVSGRAYGL